MEFQKCFTLLATRPAHAHKHCEEETHALEHATDVKAFAIQDFLNLTQADDLTRKSPRALVQTFNRLQEMRVQIFTDFRLGFQRHKKTQQFPAFCSGIKDRFAAVSEQINHIEKLLRNEKQQVAIAQLLRKIQVEEKEKLLLTSALLIEKMRFSDAAKQHEPDHSTVAFLTRSVETLTTKHTDCVVRINEILEELQAESADLEDPKVH